MTIDPSHDPVADHPLLSRVEQSALAGLELRRPSADPDDDGLALYDGPVLAEPHLELFSRDALVVICKEVAVQVHLLVRSLGLSLADAVGTEKATEILEAEMVGSGWIMSERLARLLDVSSATGSLDEIETILSLHPMFQPAEYQPIALEHEGDALHLRLLDGPAAADDDGASWASLLRSGRDKGLVAAVQAINRRARVEPIEGSEVPSWTITLDPEATPVAVPDWVAIGHLSGSSKFEFEQRVSITKRPADRVRT